MVWKTAHFDSITFSAWGRSMAAHTRASQSGQAVSGKLCHDFIVEEAEHFYGQSIFFKVNDMKRPTGISLINCTGLYLK